MVGQDVSHPSWPAMSSGDPVTYRVEVRQVYKGRVGPVTLVHYPPDATIRLPERHLATTVWGVGGAALALVAMVASGRAVRSRLRP